ncbi:MAG: hypothetical protein Q9166_002023 [cf. Caloplaca sp. 2 TL-2023]
MKRRRELDGDEVTVRVKPAKHSEEYDEESETEQLDIDSAKDINSAIGRMDSRLLADYVAQRTKRFGQDLSLVELEEMHVPEGAILDTSEWEQERLEYGLPSFLMHFAHLEGRSDLSGAPKTPGSPHTLVLTGAALRAAELSRDATIAKLFAKHIKLNDAVAFVKKTRLENLERIIIDCSYLDQKQRSIFDMKETQQPLMRLLNKEDLKARYTDTSSPVRLIFF